MSLAADLIKRFEGCRLEAYPDPATGGKPWTVGYGCTGPGIGPGTIWTQQQAEDELEHRLFAERQVLDSLVTAPVSENQMAALLSLAWNIGTAALGGSHLLRLLNAGDVQGAADAFLAWNHAAGKVMPGLTTRREAERAVFLTPDAPTETAC